MSSRPELSNSPLIIDFCLPRATRASTSHCVEEAVPIMAGTAFSPPPLSNAPAKHISVMHCKISCWDFFFSRHAWVYDFEQGCPLSPLQLRCSTVTATLDPLHNRNCISLLTQCRDPMQTLAASRGTVGSVGRSLAHSLSTDTAYADWRRMGERGGGNKKGWLDDAVTEPKQYISVIYTKKCHEVKKQNQKSHQQQVIDFIPTFHMHRHTCAHMCTPTHTLPTLRRTAPRNWPWLGTS